MRGDLPVLSDVTFGVTPGQALALTGPNGVGKTTLLRTLVGLQPSDGGSISLAADQFAYCGHANAVKSALTVHENLSFWAAVYGTELRDSVLVSLNLASLRDRLAAHLSSGQLRRLGLARIALSARPVWALDEPTVGLDDASRGLLDAMIGDHLAKGGMAVIATHAEIAVAADVLDVSRFQAEPPRRMSEFDEAFV